MSNALYVILAIALVIVLVILYKKFPFLSIAIKTILAIALIIGTGYSIIEINKYYSASGGVFGAISGYFDTNKTTVDNMTFSFENVEFKQESGDLYSLKIQTNDIFKLKEDTPYGMYVSDIPCSNVENEEDYIISTYTYNFYDDNIELILSDTLTFKFAFYEKYTSLSVFTDGGQEAVKLWDYYFNKNEFLLTIRPADYSSGNELESGVGVAPEVFFLSYNVEGEVSKVLVTKGTTISNVTYTPKKENYVFKGWSLDGETVLSSSYSISEDTTVYAVFELAPGKWVTLDFDDEPTYWFNVEPNTTSDAGFDSGQIYTYLTTENFITSRVTLNYFQFQSGVTFYTFDEEGNLREGTSRGDIPIVLKEGDVLVLKSILNGEELIMELSYNYYPRDYETYFEPTFTLTYNANLNIKILTVSFILEVYQVY